eukprot:gb/GECH01011126.1/.p1 GENE.gb/GECH01011126.1/~~gb/GECH01011126.1/.p1  ORF type:complete len:153 (+),score=51.58 gb/GECH01011126.1/:1-459(+)
MSETQQQINNMQTSLHQAVTLITSEESNEISSENNDDLKQCMEKFTKSVKHVEEQLNDMKNNIRGTALTDQVKQLEHQVSDKDRVIEENMSKLHEFNERFIGLLSDRKDTEELTKGMMNLKPIDEMDNQVEEETTGNDDITPGEDADINTMS